MNNTAYFESKQRVCKKENNEFENISKSQIKKKIKTNQELLSVYRKDLETYQDCLEREKVPNNLKHNCFPKLACPFSSMENEKCFKQIIKTWQNDLLQFSIKNLKEICLKIEMEIEKLENAKKSKKP